MTQSRHVAGEALLLCSLSSPLASSLYLASPTAIWPSTVWPRQQWRFFFSVLRWHSCPHCTGIIASFKLSLLPALHRHRCRVGLRRSSRCSAGFCRHCAGVSPASRWRHCQHCAVVVVAGVVPASSPLAHGHLCPDCAPLVMTFTLPPSLSNVASSPYPVSLTPVLHFCCLTPSQQCPCLCHDVLVGASHGGCCCLGHNHPPGDSGVCHLELFL